MTLFPIQFILPSKFSFKIYIYSQFYIWYLKRHGYEVVTSENNLEIKHLCTWGPLPENLSSFKSITLLEKSNFKSVFELLDIFIKKAEEDYISESFSYK